MTSLNLYFLMPNRIVEPHRWQRITSGKFGRNSGERFSSISLLGGEQSKTKKKRKNKFILQELRIECCKNTAFHFIHNTIKNQFSTNILNAERPKNGKTQMGLQQTYGYQRQTLVGEKIKQKIWIQKSR